MASFARKINRTHARTVILAQARAGGCTCDPDITLPSMEVGKVRMVSVAHDWDCPHRRDAALPAGLKDRINAGEFDPTKPE